MAIFIATMMEDGCYDAHYLDENGKVVYDISKDARFSKFWKYKNGPKTMWDREYYD
jgi:hypothetical protein